jgi:hypothetical protein
VLNPNPLEWYATIAVLLLVVFARPLLWKILRFVALAVIHALSR